MIDYPALIERVRAHPSLVRGLRAANRALTCLGYASYALLLVTVALLDASLLAECIIVPGASFLIVTALRALIDEERPYARMGYAPIIDKTTTGRSFPSRHAFCMFMIAASWLDLAVKTHGALGAVDALAIILFASAVLLGTIRVVAGVHYLKDVIAGAAIALVLAHIGYMMVFA